MNPVCVLSCNKALDKSTHTISKKTRVFQSLDQIIKFNLLCGIITCPQSCRYIYIAHNTTRCCTGEISQVN